MRKLKALSLIELILGMVLSSIVVAFCYSGYSLIFERFMQFKKTKAKVNEIMQMNTTLLSDFSRANSIMYNNNQLSASCDSATFQYEFNEEYVLRKMNEVVDTFFLVPRDIKVKLLNEEPVEESGLLKEFSFDAEVFGKNETFQYLKIYSAEVLIQNQAKNGN
jgi:hypothetical protein